MPCALNKAKNSLILSFPSELVSISVKAPLRASISSAFSFTRLDALNLVALNYVWYEKI